MLRNRLVSTETLIVQTQMERTPNITFVFSFQTEFVWEFTDCFYTFKNVYPVKKIE